MRRLMICIATASLILLTGCENFISPLSSISKEESNLVDSTAETQSSDSWELKDIVCNSKDTAVVKNNKSMLSLTSKTNIGSQVNFYFYFSNDSITGIELVISTKPDESIEDILTALGLGVRPPDFERLENVYTLSATKHLEALLGETYDSLYAYLCSVVSVANDESSAQNNSLKSTFEEANAPNIQQFSESTFKLEKSSMRVRIGQTRQIVIAECPEGYEDSLVWSSTNPSYVIVDEYGNVTGKSSGVSVVNVSIESAGVYQSIVIYAY